jgi:hypothetical protein
MATKNKKKESNIELIHNNRSMEMENTYYGTGLIPKKTQSNQCWKAFLSKLNIHPIAK